MESDAARGEKVSVAGDEVAGADGEAGAVNGEGLGAGWRLRDADGGVRRCGFSQYYQ